MTKEAPFDITGGGTGGWRSLCVYKHHSTPLSAAYIADTELMASPADFKRGRSVLANDKVIVRITPSMSIENISTEPFWSFMFIWIIY